MQLQDHLTEKMTLQPGSTGPLAELSLLHKRYQQTVHSLWKSSCSRGSLALYLGKPGSQPTHIKALLGVTDFMVQLKHK